LRTDENLRESAINVRKSESEKQRFSCCRRNPRSTSRRMDSQSESENLLRAEDAEDEPNSSLLEQKAAVFAFTINYIFGAGVLGIPYAISHGGILVSVLTLIISSLFSLMAMLWLLETLERANAYKGTAGIVEFSELCQLFVGPRTKRVYEASLTIYVFSSAWMYASIASLSLAKAIPISSNPIECELTEPGFLWNYPRKSCYYDYLGWLSVFAVFQGILVQLDMGLMKKLQLSFTGIGLVAILLMVTTVAIAIPEEGLARIDRRVEIFNPSGYGLSFGTFVFAQLCHPGVPLLSYIPRNREIVKPVFVGVISTTTAMYLILGIMCALFFGVDPSRRDPHAVSKIITLNWVDYSAGAQDAGAIANIIKFYIQLYPAITCGAAFPLYVITLGNGWYETIFGNTEELEEPLIAPSRNSKKWFYFGAGLPSILAAAAMADVAFMLLFVGVTGFMLAFIIPPILQMRSKVILPSVTTQFANIFSGNQYCYLCLSFATIAMVFTIVQPFI